MAVVTVRNLPEETHHALKLRSAQPGHSTEAEVRQNLEDQVHSASRIQVGSVLSAFGRRVHGIDLNVARGKRPVAPANFE